MKSLSSFKHIGVYRASGFWLIIATLAALVIANFFPCMHYAEWWTQPVRLSIGSFNLFGHGKETLTLMDVINDFLMAIFFLAVGLEIKREVLVGELSSLRKAMLPIIGACGGMLVPVLVFLIFCPKDPLMLRGAAIPMATDIAFSLGVLAAFGRRVPVGLKVFLAALAVADDLGGIIVIALFYTTHLSALHLIGAALCIALLVALNLRRCRGKVYYLAAGFALWYMMLNSGIHATIAGVVVAFCIPASLPGGTRTYMAQIEEDLQHFPSFATAEDDARPVILTAEEIHTLRSIEAASDHLISPLQDMEDHLRFPVNYLIIPLFAFANAGINLGEMAPENLFSGVGLAVFLGLLVGKVAGVFTLSWLCIRRGWVSLPEGVTWRTFAGVCMLCGIGFTVAMFIANLSYSDTACQSMLADAKLGILCGSLLSATIGFLVLHRFLPKSR